MKVVLDVETNSINPKENDILIFKDGKWKAISKQAFLVEFNNTLVLQDFKLEELKKDIEKFKEDFAKLSKIVREI